MPEACLPACNVLMSLGRFCRQIDNEDLIVRHDFPFVTVLHHVERVDKDRQGLIGRDSEVRRRAEEC